MGGKYNSLTRICNLLIVPCNQLVRMVIMDDANNNFDSNTLITASMEYNRITTRIYQYSQISTSWDDNRLPCHQYVTVGLFTVTNLFVWYLWRVYLTIMEPLHLELSPQSTIVYSRIHQYSENCKLWVENTNPCHQYVICSLFPEINLSVW